MTSASAAAGLAIQSSAIIGATVAEAREERDTDGGGDAALAARLADSDPDALAEAYERFGRITFGFLVKTLGDRQTAEDVQQQVFLEVWQRAAQYDPARGGLLNWVMTIARSRAIDQLRRRIPEPVGGAEQAQFDRGAEGAVDEVDRLVERYRVAGLLSGLPREEHRLLRMRFYDELSQSEIADATGIPLGTVKLRMTSALGRLRALLEEEG
jgi:RNA polymerase sigma-70 factor (ECF subfamily)